MTDPKTPAPRAMDFDKTCFERFLSDISDPFLTRDITRWRARMRLPFSMITAEGPVLLQTEDEVVRNFGYYLIAVDVLKFNQVVRTPIHIQHCENETVIATYRTELLRNGTRQTEPYTSSALLHRTPEGWKMSSIVNARGHHPWSGMAPLSEDDDA